MMRSLLKILLLASVLGTAPQALAGKLDVRDLLGQVQDAAIADSRDARHLRVAQSNGPSLSEAVEMVKRQYKGRIVSAETRMSGNREVHHIKVLTEDGKVKTVKIQGRSRQP
jgi:uncharacterized membrane protein YkoI